MKAMPFNEDIFGYLFMEDFQNQDFLVLELISLQGAAEQLPYSEFSAESLRLKMFFPWSK